MGGVLLILSACSVSEYSPRPTSKGVTREGLGSEQSPEFSPEKRNDEESRPVNDTSGNGSAGPSLADQNERVARVNALIDKYDNGPIADRITVESLKSLLSESESPVYVVDSRRREEFETSHLPGAIHQSEFEQMLDDEAIPLGSHVVFYCTIGYRSSKSTQKLAGQQTALRVWNLEGSILMWVNLGNSVFETGGAETKRVHVYGKEWNVLPRGYTPVMF